MMNKYVQANIAFSCSTQPVQVSTLIFKSYEELLNYLCRTVNCRLLDYELISIVRRVREKE